MRIANQEKEGRVTVPRCEDETRPEGSETASELFVQILSKSTFALHAP